MSSYQARKFPVSVTPEGLRAWRGEAVNEVENELEGLKRGCSSRPVRTGVWYCPTSWTPCTHRTAFRTHFFKLGYHGVMSGLTMIVLSNLLPTGDGTSYYTRDWQSTCS